MTGTRRTIPGTDGATSTRTPGGYRDGTGRDVHDTDGRLLGTVYKRSRTATAAGGYVRSPFGGGAYLGANLVEAVAALRAERAERAEQAYAAESLRLMRDSL